VNRWSIPADRPPVHQAQTIDRPPAQKCLDTARCQQRDDELVSEQSYGPFERPVSITEAEWTLLEAVRGRTLSEASHDLGMPTYRVRFLLANIGQKLSIASKL
jgi:hypothetical protein